MKAVFKKSNRILFVGFLIISLIVVGVCVFVLVKDSTTMVGDIIACCFIPIIYLSFAIIPFIYNHKAYLHINDNKIIGKFGLLKRLECDVTDVTFALAKFDTLHIVLKDKKYCIRGIENAYAISAFIQQKMPFSPCAVTKEVIENIKKRTKNRKRYIIWVYCLVGLSFVWVFITMFLTGLRDLPEFSQMDWIFFWIMWALEVPTVIAMFVFAIRSRKGNLKFEKQNYEIRRSVLESAPLLSGPGYLMAVFADCEFTQRITLYGGCIESDPLSACYYIEVLNEDYKPKTLFQTEIFISEDYDEMFGVFLNITDKFI
ncbi:MAG: hypothetical protein IJ345_02000 [Clostridia bacterium]|nr:hypothetical protein [Clostridia bacterium]